MTTKRYGLRLIYLLKQMVSSIIVRLKFRFSEKATKIWKNIPFSYFNPIPTGLGHVTLIYGLIPPMAGRNRVNTTE